MQHGDTTQRALQTFGGAHNADIVPHKEAQLVPVMLDDDQLIGVFHATFIPRGQFFRLTRVRHALVNIFRRRPTVDQTLQQRIRRHAVGAVQAGIAHFANGIKAVNISATIVVNHHAAAGVVCSRHDRYRFFGQVDAKAQ